MYSAFISGILSAVLFLEKSVAEPGERHRRAARVNEARNRLSQKEQMDSLAWRTESSGFTDVYKIMADLGNVHRE